MMTQLHTPPADTINTLLQRRAQPRIFLVSWDNSKTRTRDSRKNEKQEAWGVVFPNGLVALDNGATFSMMGELHHLLDLKGQYEIKYLDEMEGAS